MLEFQLKARTNLVQRPPGIPSVRASRRATFSDSEDNPLSPSLTVSLPSFLLAVAQTPKLRHGRGRAHFNLLLLLAAKSGMMKGITRVMNGPQTWRALSSTPSYQRSLSISELSRPQG